MKTILTPSVVFNPSAQTINLSSIPGFDSRLLYTIINVTQSAILYAPGTTGTGISSDNGAGLLTLEANTSSMSSTDKIMVIYEVTTALSGVHDDGTNEGVIRAKIVAGELVKVPLTQNEFNIYFAPGGSSSGVYTPFGNPLNGDGTAGAIAMVAGVPAPNGVAVQAIIWGSVVGVRFLRNAVAAPFDVLIDGVAYAMDDTQWTYTSNNASLDDAEAAWIVATDLPDGPHRVSVMLASDSAGAASQHMTFYGWIAERRAGYTEHLPLSDVQPVVTLTTAAVAFTSLLGGGYFKSIRKLVYTNTSGSPVTVTLKFNNVVYAQYSLAAAGTAGCTLDLDMTDHVAFQNATASFSHLASAATAVNCLVIGRR